MYLGNIDIENRGRYAVNLSGLGLFGSKKKKRRRAAEKAAAELRISNLEKMMLLQIKPTVQAPPPSAPPPIAPVTGPVAPSPVVNIAAPPVKAGMPVWAVPAAIGGALLLVAAFVVPQLKKAR